MSDQLYQLYQSFTDANLDDLRQALLLDYAEARSRDEQESMAFCQSRLQVIERIRLERQQDLRSRS